MPATADWAFGVIRGMAMSNGVRWEIYMNIKIEMQVGKDKTF